MALPYLRTCLTYTKYAAGTVFVASMTTAWYYRPIADYTSSSSLEHDNNNNSYESSTAKENRDSSHSSSSGGSSIHQAPILSTDSILPTLNNNNSIESNNRNGRSNEFFCAPYTSPPYSRSHVPILLQWARSISIGVTTIAIRIFMNTYGRYEIVEDESYQKFLEAVLDREDRDESNNYDTTDNGQQQEGNIHNNNQQQGLITVSNHRSLFDDPGIVSCLLPLPHAIQPKYNRWALCSQEYCFNDALPGIIKGYLGAGQVLPICRGGGINQQLLLDFGRHLANGEWCHIFPEGGVWQWDELGGRRELPKNATMGSSSDFGKKNETHQTTTSVDTTTANKEEDDDRIRIIPATTQQKHLPPSSIGKLKWGVGKLIAHAPITPKVIPFAHKGMEKLLPQDEITGKTRLRDNILSGLLPSILGGNDEEDKLQIKVQFGKEITFDDLIQDHERKYGRLRKYYCGKLNAEEEYNDKRVGTTDDQQQYSENNIIRLQQWHSSREERVLYHKIARRIECHLDILTKQVCQDEE